MALSPIPRALFFDVFGTCVDWRSSVVSELHTQSHAALNAATASLASTVRITASDMTMQSWGEFAQQWRNSYKKFTRQLAADSSIPWVSVDEHHLHALRELVIKWHLDGLWNDEQMRDISLVWHRLKPWDDAAAGVQLLNQTCYTCTLSNGNLSLLTDLRAFSGIPFTHLFSAEMFGTYKPAAAVYTGAAEKLGLLPEQCAMVAAHLNDLKAAKENGLRTVYVERLGEEDWDRDGVEQARREGWVDLWIGVGDGNEGFVTVAGRLGVDGSDVSRVR